MQEVDFYLSDPFFKQRVDMEKEFFEYLKKSTKTRNNRIKLINKKKDEITKLRAETTGFDFKTDFNQNFKEKLENIQKLKTDIEKLEKKNLYFDEIVRDYAQDFENRRETKDKKDFIELCKDKQTFKNDISITKRIVYRQKIELKALNASIAQYYHHYPDKPKNIDIDDLISRKKMLTKDITRNTNFILDCENKVELLEIKLKFISSTSSQSDNQGFCAKEENLFNFFKFIHARGSLLKTIDTLRSFIDRLKPKLSELNVELHSYDRKMSVKDQESEDEAFDDHMVQLFEGLNDDNSELKNIINEHVIEFYGTNSYNKKWTISNLRRTIEVVQKQTSNMDKFGELTPIVIDDSKDENMNDLDVVEIVHKTSDNFCNQTRSFGNIYQEPVHTRINFVNNEKNSDIELN